MRSWDYQALLIQDAVGVHPGTVPGSPEALRQMSTSASAVATQVAASNSSAPGTPRIAVDPILYPVRAMRESYKTLPATGWAVTCHGMHVTFSIYTYIYICIHGRRT